MADEDEVTPPMIDAGVRVYLESSFEEEDDLIRAIYLAMLQARKDAEQAVANA